MKIGLFGGAFNPIHNGHIQVAENAIKKAGLDKVIFIPTGNAPHKKETEISRKDRLNMLLLALEDRENMIVSDYELKKETVSYSADTAEYFKKLYPQDELFFIIGDDSYNQLDSWREPERITKVEKPAILIDMEKVEISSSQIRDKIKFGKDFRNLLPKKVFDYIIKGNLYTDKSDGLD